VNLAASGTFLTVANTAAVAIPNDIVFPAPASAVTCTLIKNSPGATTGTQLSFNGTLSGGNANMELFLNSNTGSDNTTTYLFAGTNTFLAADINLNRGSIIVASPSGLGDPSNLIEIDANNNYTLGDLRFAISMTLTNPIELVWDANNIGVGTNNVTLLGPISGTGPLNKVGTGTLTLGTANSYSGVTTVSNGHWRWMDLPAPGGHDQWRHLGRDRLYQRRRHDQKRRHPGRRQCGRIGHAFDLWRPHLEFRQHEPDAHQQDRRLDCQRQFERHVQLYLGWHAHRDQRHQRCESARGG